jgi:hypothetical protein
MYVAGWSTARDRSPTGTRRLRFGAALGTEGELDGGDEAADG